MGQLVISRKLHQGVTLYVGDDQLPIHVTVSQITPSQIRLAIEAPEDVMIMRDELVAEVRAANQEAAAGAVPPLKRRQVR